ncbi:hypothetical protein BD779DRAFT_139783 [Infundibulicybe gibba]|nr:hypothetical protein BD779DRAFT_139783 [Infundibulicybe gibba]
MSGSWFSWGRGKLENSFGLVMLLRCFPGLGAAFIIPKPRRSDPNHTGASPCALNRCLVDMSVLKSAISDLVIGQVASAQGYSVQCPGIGFLGPSGNTVYMTKQPLNEYRAEIPLIKSRMPHHIISGTAAPSHLISNRQQSGSPSVPSED